MKTLKQLLGICDHKWIKKESINVYDFSTSTDIPRYHKYVLKCEKCGDLKIIKT